MKLHTSFYWARSCVYKDQGRIQKIQKEGAEYPAWMKSSLFRTCSNKVTLMFQKHFENTRKKGWGTAPSAPSLNLPMASDAYNVFLTVKVHLLPKYSTPGTVWLKLVYTYCTYCMAWKMSLLHTCTIWLTILNLTVWKHSLNGKIPDFSRTVKEFDNISKLNQQK